MKRILRTAILLASLSLMVVCLQVSCPAIYGPAWDSIKESSERNEFGGGTSGGAGAGGGY